MATSAPLGSWMTGPSAGGGGLRNMAQGVSGALGLPPKPPNPMVEAMKTGAPTGGWGSMGVKPNAVAAFNPWTPTKGAPEMVTGGPGGIVDAMRAMEGPAPGIAQAMQRGRGGPEPESYSDPYEAAKQARLSGRPVPQPAAPAAPQVPPPAPPVAAQQPAGPPPGIAQNMGLIGQNPAQTVANAMRANAFAPRPAAPPQAAAAPEFSDPYEAMKQARLRGRGRG